MDSVSLSDQDSEESVEGHLGKSWSKSFVAKPPSSKIVCIEVKVPLSQPELVGGLYLQKLANRLISPVGILSQTKKIPGKRLVNLSG